MAISYKLPILSNVVQCILKELLSMAWQAINVKGTWCRRLKPPAVLWKPKRCPVAAKTEGVVYYSAPLLDQWWLLRHQCCIKNCFHIKKYKEYSKSYSVLWKQNVHQKNNNFLQYCSESTVQPTQHTHCSTHFCLNIYFVLMD